MKDKKFLDAIKNKLKKEEADQKEKGQGKSKTFGDMYPFWNIQEGLEHAATIRVLPHKGMEDDSTDPFIYKYEHILSIGGKDVKFPCPKTFDEDCPVCALSAKYYAAKDEDKGRYYWRDKKAIASVFVVKDPLPANEETGETEEGKLKIVQFGNQLANRYSSRWKALLPAGRMDDLPWDINGGYDFSIVKVMKGKFANYEVDSDFERDPSALPEDFLESFNPVDLTQYLPQNPGVDKVKRMLDAHLTGEDYVEEKGDGEGSDEPKTTAKTTSKDAVKEAVAAKKAAAAKAAPKQEPEPVVEEAEEVVDAEEAEETSDEDDDFLERLKRRAASK